MRELDDWHLLEKYVKTKHQEAFQTLVERYLGLVYSAAYRQVTPDHSLAQEVVQAVFTIFARKAGDLKASVIIPGWLVQTTRLAAIQAVRNKARRLQREKELAETMAIEQSTSDQSPNAAAAEEVLPSLDEALNQLKSQDRDALVLRYFQDQPLHSVAKQLGLSEEAARKRVTRSLEKLRSILGKKSVVLGSTALASLLSTQAAQAAPAGVSAISIASSATGAIPLATSTSMLVKGVLHMLYVTKIKLMAAIVLGFAAVGGTSAYVISETLAEPPWATIQATYSESPLAAFRFFVHAVNEGDGTKAASVFRVRNKEDRKMQAAVADYAEALSNFQKQYLARYANSSFRQDLFIKEGILLEYDWSQYRETMEGEHGAIYRGEEKVGAAHRQGTGWILDFLPNYSVDSLTKSTAILRETAAEIASNQFSNEGEMIGILNGRIMNSFKRLINGPPIDLSGNKLASPGSTLNLDTSSFTILPGKGVGPIQFGMSAEECFAAIGKPVIENRGRKALDYSNLGFAIHTDSDGNVAVINIATVQFKGSTVEGIRLGSTREEVLRALGDPTKTEEANQGGGGMIYYESKRMKLMIDAAGKVSSIELRRP